MTIPTQDFTCAKPIGDPLVCSQPRQQLARKIHVALTAFLGVAAIVLAIQNNGLEQKLEVERRSNSEMSAELAPYLKLDTRSSQRQTAQVVDFQAWAQEQEVYQERVRGVECRVDRLAQNKWHVTKRRVGSDIVVTADLAIGGPEACDRVLL